MDKLRIEIAKLESRTPLYSYSYQVEPKTEGGKIAFALYNRKGGIEKTIDVFLENNLDMNRSPFIGKFTFHYDDPSKTESDRKNIVKEHAKRLMSNSGVPGINHALSHVITRYSNMVEGVDYVINVGEKVIHEKSDTLTFDDIRKL